MIKRWHRAYRIIPFIILAIGIGSCILSFVFGANFRFNLSDSLPQNLFFSFPSKPPFDKGEIVNFEHPLLNLSVGKIIAGKPGDQISIRNQTVYINDFEIGFVKTESKSGKIYHPIPEGVISDGNYFVFTPHAESFDSRYIEFGLVPEAWIKEVLWPLF